MNIQDLDAAETKLQTYCKLRGPGLRLKLLRIKEFGHRYLLSEFFHRIHISFDITSRLFWGRNIKLPIDDVDSKYLFMFGLLGKAELPLTKYLIKNSSPETVFYDIGANYGFFSYLVNECAAPNGEVHLFEANKSVYEYLKRNVSLKDTRIHSNNIAVSSLDGEVDFFSAFSSGASGISTTVSELVAERPNQFISSKVPSIKLDTYTKSHKTPTIMKLDVEGGELEVLKGAQELLTNHKVVVAMEVWSGDLGQAHSQHSAIFLKNLGYEQYALSDNGDLVESLDCMPTNGYANYIFKKNATNTD